ncbi:winged helix-turn-helix domain-containing protein [Salarchaeum sp. JOR-1]|uniref:ArsR/SmtB family transcription factor n=1 Tax=Salarchaeum sp. JOR-1 TaxID=2599399 RepID=UPI0011985427|nr:winged helix-turn-helix domain-containing protein [Salarchaeum sp. JOR-1]QDX40245.1 helix-turn-helix transcriptional regulator [Salarchaeum sp. JOR-1]
MSLLPSQKPDAPDGDPRVIGVDSEDADRVLSALSAGTARTMLTTLHEEPATASELADDVETSLQNAQYHLGKLRDADLVEVAGTSYSEKGREMDVYAPTDAPLVLFAGDENTGRTVQSMLGSLLGAVAVLGVASLLVQYLTEHVFASNAGSAGGFSTMNVDTASNAAGGVPPGVLFFLGGVLALVLAAGYRYWR